MWEGSAPAAAPALPSTLSAASTTAGVADEGAYAGVAGRLEVGVEGGRLGAEGGLGILLRPRLLALPLPPPVTALLLAPFSPPAPELHTAVWLSLPALSAAPLPVLLAALLAPALSVGFGLRVSKRGFGVSMPCRPPLADHPTPAPEPAPGAGSGLAAPGSAGRCTLTAESPSAPAAAGLGLGINC
jgi:hypothetical protein